VYRDLKNKNIILTGGSGFLGRQITNAFKAAGSNIIILDIKKPQIAKKIEYYNCDITNEDEVKKIAKKIVKKKRIDVLINNAASDYVPSKTNKDFSLENFNLNIWNKDIEVSLNGSFICTKIFGSIMASQKKGVILNISSDLSIIAPNQDLYKSLNFIKPVSYSVVKHGINGLTKYTAAYWAKKNVRCNALAPGGIFNNQKKSFLEKIKKVIPLKRLAKKNEYNDLILFLCSESSSYMTGSIVISDGGRTII
jgi:NAD(P)-dependent dehydrogenase (short-subunit alcohol dehydrogenase family)